MLSCAAQAFCDQVVQESASDSDLVWIHDYHLLVLPSLLRKWVTLDMEISYYGVQEQQTPAQLCTARQGLAMCAKVRA